MARPRKEIDQQQFEKLCGMHCTMEEILGWFGITDKTLTSWCKRTYKMSFSEVYNKKKELGNISLRRLQFKLAEKSPAMAIFLGKNYLGQSDKVEQTVAVISDETREQVSRLVDGLDEGDSCPDS
jgi:hypothetical protein